LVLALTGKVKLSAILVLTLVMGAVAAPVAGQGSKAVLLLHSLGHDAPGRFPFDTAFARAISETAHGSVELYVETLDPNRFGGELLTRTREYLRVKYANKRIAAVAVVYDEALAFLLDEHDLLFPEVPIAVMLLQRPQALPERVAVMYAGNMIGESLSLALKLTPHARQIAIIDGAPPGGGGRNALNAEIQDQIEAMRLPLPVVYLRNLQLDDLLARVQALPPDGIVFFARHYIGRRGEPIDSIEAVREVTRVARAPVFVSTDTMIGPGGIGGVVIPLESMATDLAKLALRISEPGSLPLPPTEGRLVPMFDWRELRRWSIDERLLPPGSDVRFRELSLWDRYWGYVVVAVSLTLVQSMLIAGLVVQRARRRRTELALRESEQRFRVMADTAPVLIWRSGTDKACDFFNKPWLDFRGRTLEQEAGLGWTDGVHPDDRASCVQTYVSAFEARQPFRMEYRLQRADGEYRWVLDIGVPRHEDAGRFAGYIGSVIDITERKQIEEQNQDLAGRLITVQEEERGRIARDLHDDVSQQLAGVAIILSGLKHKAGKPGVEADFEGAVATLQARITTLTQGIRQLSHELHPSVLEHVGLVATLRRHCADVEAHHQITVNVSASDHLDSLRPEVALCLFRVAQEAITNAVRHAHGRTIQVQLTATNEGVDLQVDDDGIGFVASERIGRGLGLRSIDERVRLIRGHVRVESRPDQGTHLLVRIPQQAAQTELSSVSSTRGSYIALST
jgi:PAS domain S-box-containing protein